MTFLHHDVLGKVKNSPAPTPSTDCSLLQTGIQPRAAIAFVERADTGGEFTGPASRPPFASVGGPNFPVDAGWADRLTHEQTDNLEFATSVRAFDDTEYKVGFPYLPFGVAAVQHNSASCAGETGWLRSLVAPEPTRRLHALQLR